MDIKNRRTLVPLAALVALTVGIAVFVVGGGFFEPAANSQAHPPAAAEEPTDRPVETPSPSGADSNGDESRHTQARRRMVEKDLAARDITDEAVLKAMGKVPRHHFVAEQLIAEAYSDYPLPITHGQTISQPYIVALMTQLARPKPESRALDIGTGSGYQAAVLAELCKEVYSIEIVEPLAKQAKKRLARLGYENVTVRAGDGYRGWPEKAPFDLIIVAAAPDHVPQPLVDQLAPGGRLVIPVGDFYQELLLVKKDADGNVRRKSVVAVRFVPMTGEARDKKP